MFLSPSGEALVNPVKHAWSGPSPLGTPGTALAGRRGTAEASARAPVAIPPGSQHVQLQLKKGIQGPGLPTRPPTLVIGLGRLGHVHGQLAAERIHAHHARVCGGVTQGGDLVVIAGDAVQGLGDVGRSLQNDLLGAGTHKCPLHQGWLCRHPGPCGTRLPGPRGPLAQAVTKLNFPMGKELPSGRSLSDVPTAF